LSSRKRWAAYGGRLLVLGGIGLAPIPLAAQQTPLDDPYRETVTVGVLGGALPDYEGSKGYRLYPVPVALGSVKGHGFALAGNQLTVDLIADKPGPNWDFQAGPIANLNIERSSRNDIADPRVRALGSRSVALELGGFVGLGKTGVLTSPYDKLSVSLSYRHDVTGVHNSGIWQPGARYDMPLSAKVAVSLYGSAEIAESGYARTYYSISAADNRASGLNIYDAKGGLKNWNVALMGSYSLIGNVQHGLKLVATGGYGRMAGSIERSPLVQVAGSPDQWLGAIGLAYTF